jgi:hypothetical protein
MNTTIRRKQYRLTWSRTFPGEHAFLDTGWRWDSYVESEYSGPYTYKFSKVFHSRKRVDRFVILLTSDEPWRALPPLERLGPEDFACCASFTCECGEFLTCAEDTEKRRKGLPPVHGITVEVRTVTTGPWVEDEL